MRQRLLSAVLLGLFVAAGCARSTIAPPDAVAVADAGVRSRDAGPAARDAGPGGREHDAGPGIDELCEDEPRVIVHHDDGIADASFARSSNGYAVTWRTLVDGVPAGAHVAAFDRQGRPSGAVRDVPPSRVFRGWDVGPYYRIGADGVEVLAQDGSILHTSRPLECGFEGRFQADEDVWGVCADGRIARLEAPGAVHDWTLSIYDVVARGVFAVMEGYAYVADPPAQGQPQKIERVSLYGDADRPSLELGPLEQVVAATSPSQRGCVRFLVSRPVDAAQTRFLPRVLSDCSDEEPAFHEQVDGLVGHPTLSRMRSGLRGAIAPETVPGAFAFVFGPVEGPGPTQVVLVEDGVVEAWTWSWGHDYVAPRIVEDDASYTVLGGRRTRADDLDSDLLLGCASSRL